MLARADQLAGKSAGFVNPAVYRWRATSTRSRTSSRRARSIQSRSDFVNSIDPSDGFEFTTRIIDYEGQEQFCDANNVCTTRKVALNVKPGYDNMTGIGSPTSGFVRALGREHNLNRR